MTSFKTIVVIAFATLSSIQDATAKPIRETKNEKRAIFPGIILPLRSDGKHISLIFNRKMTQPTDNPQLPAVFNMRLTSTCVTSTINVVGNQPNPAAGMTLWFGIKPIGQTEDFVFSGPLIGKTIQQPTAFTGDLCLKSRNSPHQPFIHMLSRFDDKTISFWFGQTEGGSVGEFGLGTANARRISISQPPIRFPLKSLQFDVDMPLTWESRLQYQIVADGVNVPNANCPIAFDHGVTPFAVPKPIYDFLVRGLRASLSSAVNSIGLQPDPLSIVKGFTDNSVSRFDCQDAARLPNLRIGALNIPKRMLYSVVDGTCLLLIVPYNLNPNQHCKTVFGLAILKNYHTEVNMNTPGAEYVQLSVPSTTQQNPVAEGGASSSSSRGRQYPNSGPSGEPSSKKQKTADST